jgi:hypothetical protein
MLTCVKWLVPVFALALPMTARAQADDALYCKALTIKYQAFIENLHGHSMQPGSPDGHAAVAQCQSGNTAAGIPVLEQKLRDAKIERPRRSWYRESQGLIQTQCHPARRGKWKI